MEIWWLNNEDRSGAFSTVEKAFASLKKCADRCCWRNLREIDGGEDWKTYAFEWENPRTGEASTDTVWIGKYILDEDNG